MHGPDVSHDEVHPAAEELRELIQELTELRADMLAGESQLLRHHPELDPAHDLSARNLAHYLALRARDLRALQPRLMRLGLSSLGRCEAHALATVEAVLGVLKRLAGDDPGIEPVQRIGASEGQRRLDRHADALLGPQRLERSVRILVTMPDEVADDVETLRDWIVRGMDAARINCAHGTPDTWERTVSALRRASADTGRPCRILMDLAGPKLRTGPLAAGPEVLKVKPERDELGRVLRPAVLWLTGRAAPLPAPAGCRAVLPVEDAWLAGLDAGDELTLTDARGAHRRLRVVQREREGARVEVSSTVYLVTGTELERAEGGKAPARTRVGPLPARPGEITLSAGERLVLTRSLEPGHGLQRDEQGRCLAPARLGCTLSEAFGQVRAGERVFLDDGRIGARVVAAGTDELELVITSARPGGSKLRADKGINLPDTHLRLPALTSKDEQDLAFVARHADGVALSFVHEPADVVDLVQRLAALGKPKLHFVLKIETRRAFDNLPGLLLAALRGASAGVMIARGDLAVECGFERLAEVQEEILWICEAAHVPVIWATQVLETLAREGRPSRAEITDAAMSERAECVMLNKGPHIASALTVLDDILRRMQGHQRKKSPMLRPLGLARHARL